ncbi:MAG: alpha-amylase family glycosyl hydrolase [Bacteroidota bacterium]
MTTTLLITSHNKPSHSGFLSIYEFHIHRSARVKYQVQESLFESTGNVIFPNYRAVRELAHSINKKRGVEQDPRQQVRAGQLNAMGLLDEINHFLIRLYNEIENPNVIHRALQFVRDRITPAELTKTLTHFLTDFPPIAVYNDRVTIKEYLAGTTSGRPHGEIALEEMMLLFITNANPACAPFKELFDDKVLKQSTKYAAVIAALDAFFDTEKPFGPDALPLFKVLQSPFLSHPDDLAAQLGFLKERWGIILSSKFKERIAGSLEFFSEDDKYFWNLLHPAGGKQSVETFVPEYKRRLLTESEREALLRRGVVNPDDLIYEEHQRFTPDIDWMPNVVIIAKNTYVWLDQLSKKYQRSIRRLDEIPDEELDILARWNFSGLWLIGVWERSSASKRIKQINGNLDAVSSAYSLYDYEIAWNLGGEEAFRNLNRRAWERGIRLAGDMVPNHMGLYSKWIVEHPEYFIQSDHPPYPNYIFTGENLSEHPDIEVRIEDGYWRKSDAAVVFQRIDKRTGEVRYVYHGNDGTNMPWNDTAQLNLLRADVREAIIQNILHVARKFSIIRFDAAMTLAKKHYQRLWFPMPGTSGVPSRQDHSLSRSEFDALFPTEFWREVVDRCNREMPHTLLLAEAFWLMEGYFVRTLGMHRVYNSAFMHMLMKEENQKFRSLIKNTLEFNPEILKRYVNFMSNPDEETAIDQFGRDDKYFGVAVMMTTLPGLPMFAHGQIEGYREKYGMEYQRAYYNESPDYWLVKRHEEEIFPLMKKRFLFSQVRHFEFYDYLDDRGFVNENVFAYSNRSGGERAVVFFHNTYAECKGYIKYSLPKAVAEGGAVRSVSLAEALQIRNDESHFYRFREQRTKLEYLVSGRQFYESGWWIELKAFQYVVFVDFIEMVDVNGELSEAAARTHGRGVASIESILWQTHLRPLHDTVHASLLHGSVKSKDHAVEGMKRSVDALNKILDDGSSVIDRGSEIEEQVSAVEKFLDLTKIEKGFIAYDDSAREFLLFYHFLLLCKTMLNTSGKRGVVVDVINELHLEQIVRDLCSRMNSHHSKQQVSLELFKILLKHHETVGRKNISDSEILEIILNDFESADFLSVNQHNVIWFYNKEQWETLLPWLKSIQFIYGHRGSDSTNPYRKEFVECIRTVRSILMHAEKTGYQVEKLKEYGFSSSDNRASKIQKKNSSVQRIKKSTPKRKSGTTTKNVKSITKGKRSH